jgi:hypothetical protein
MRGAKQFGGAQHFNYKSKQVHEDMVNGQHEAHMKIVEIKNGEGVKRVINIGPSGKRKSHTVRLNKREISNIRRKIFMPHLFAPLMQAVGMASAAAAAPVVRKTVRHKKAHRK